MVMVDRIIMQHTCSTRPRLQQMPTARSVHGSPAYCAATTCRATCLDTDAAPALDTDAAAALVLTPACATPACVMAN